MFKMNKWYDVPQAVRELTFIRKTYYRDSPAAIPVVAAEYKAMRDEINSMIIYLEDWDDKLSAVGPKVIDGQFTLAEVLEYMDKNHGGFRIGPYVMHRYDYSWSRCYRNLPIYHIVYCDWRDRSKDIEMWAMSLEMACKKFDYLLRLIDKRRSEPEDDFTEKPQGPEFVDCAVRL